MHEKTQDSFQANICLKLYNPTNDLTSLNIYIGACVNFFAIIRGVVISENNIINIHAMYSRVLS